MSNLIFIIIGIIFFGIPVVLAIFRLIKMSLSDKITFVKGDKRLTISSGHLTAEDKRQLVNF